ncbi:MAG: SUMF1/EgtB/PvdO family nonheme iron enzyme [Spirochaetaceae bacterium]|nr:SUMF1/EgtB/PvdO family nonheme iron enzyme [Spirochaetaceae bacterium]
MKTKNIFGLFSPASVGLIASATKQSRVLILALFAIFALMLTTCQFLGDDIDTIRERARGEINTNGEPPVTFTVTYNRNNATGGTVPIDSTQYNSGASVTVRGNTGSLYKSNHTFSGWNTQADGYGTIYMGGQTFTISANTTLYAHWVMAAYGISLSIEGEAIPNNYLQFPVANFGYGEQPSRTITVTNTENQATGPLTVTVSPAGNFVVDASISNIVVGGSATFFIRPNTGLPGGQHTATVTVSGAGGITASFAVSFTVHPPVITINTQPAPTTNVVAGNISNNLSVTASVTGGATLNYQWFSNATNSNVGGIPVTGATNASFTIPQTLAIGQYYYFVVVSATGGAIPVSSNVARVFVSNIDMVWVPGGQFELGRELGTAFSGDTTPVSVVALSGFWIGKFPVTQAQFQTVMGANPSIFTGTNAWILMSSRPATPELNRNNLPVECVNWYDAIVFCNRLSMLEGLTPAYEMPNQWPNPTIWSSNPAVWGAAPNWDSSSDILARWNNVRMVPGSTGYRLPTEAQWEYAAKGGSTPDNTTFAGSNTVTAVAWHDANSGSRTREVGDLVPNGLGIYDMSGNVWEWCWDWWDDYTAEAKTNPAGPVSGIGRVQRGGSCVDRAEFSRSVFRGGAIPEQQHVAGGFRVVRP